MAGVRAIAEHLIVAPSGIYVLSDTQIAEELVRSLKLHVLVPENIQVVIEDGWVTLSGIADWAYQREAAEDQGMVVEANCVYVIPPKKFLTIDDGTLQLSEPSTPQGRETAIDFFLRSLAKDQGERSIGIVLSGTGSQGRLGIRDIKFAGGMAIAQMPASAEFDSMPSSVISEGLADYVLPPAEIPATLIRYASIDDRPHGAFTANGQRVATRSGIAGSGRTCSVAVTWGYAGAD